LGVGLQGWAAYHALENAFKRDLGPTRPRPRTSAPGGRCTS